ncbi:hypothetical protein RIF29_24923 [Crotalaria pallida]|uniref:Uncharacterized protein n=1 Tax=Crotalaria pallida TaxID=3830 RepID=A0AAN9EKM6_CROPI
MQNDGRRHFKGHEGAVKINTAKIAWNKCSLCVTSAQQNTRVRLWQGSDDGSYNCRHILRDHTAETLNATFKV